MKRKEQITLEFKPENAEQVKAWLLEQVNSHEEIGKP